MNIIKKYVLFIFLFSLFSCSSRNNESKEIDEIKSTEHETRTYPANNETEKDNDNNETDNGCKFEDGTYSASVDYNNPETGYSATYTLDVEVQDCQVIQIDFPRGGYLDEDHISPADLDEDGHASVDGEDGKTYEIQIDR